MIFAKGVTFIPIRENESYYIIVNKYLSFWSNSFFSRVELHGCHTQEHHKGFLCRLQYSVGESDSQQEVLYIQISSGDDGEEGFGFSMAFYSSRHQLIEFIMIVPRDSPTLVSATRARKIRH